jgi:hypothetical protein
MMWCRLCPVADLCKTGLLTSRAARLSPNSAHDRPGGEFTRRPLLVPVFVRAASPHPLSPRQPMAQVLRVLLKSMKAHLLLLGDFREPSIANDNTIIANQGGHRYQQLDRKGIGAHFDQSITVGPTTFEAGQTAQPPRSNNKWQMLLPICMGTLIERDHLERS